MCVLKKKLKGAHMAIDRFPWDGFPAVWLHAEELVVKKHPDYAVAKAGDSDAAFRLVAALASDRVCSELRTAFPTDPTLVSAHAVERDGLNAIPEALAEFLAERLDWPVDPGVIQINIVGHTGADGFVRLARQARFDGPVESQTEYFLVDDFIGQGGTLANMRSFILGKGGKVLGATALTGKPYSVKLAVEKEIITQLRHKHGLDLEQWWLDRFGFGYDCLTHSEGNYLLRTPDADRIRDRIAAAVEN